MAIIAKSAGGKVYFGPNATNYASVGSTSANESVQVHWNEGVWSYIEYFVTGSEFNKRGYVETKTLSSFSGSVPVKSFSGQDRFALNACQVYYGPNPIVYQSAGSLSFAEKVSFLGEKAGTGADAYAFIEYNVTGTSQKKRAWVYANNLGTSQPGGGLVVGQYPPGMNINGAYYTTSNWYYNADPQHSLKGECTWFCWGRALEKCGKSLQFTGGNNGGQWYANINATASGVTKRAASSGPVSNSICSCSGSTSSGHVIFVELVSGSTVYFTEANVGGTDGLVKSCATSAFPPNGRTSYGYIVL